MDASQIATYDLIVVEAPSRPGLVFSSEIRRRREVPMPKITKRIVEAAEVRDICDDELPGFGVRKIS